MPVETAYKAWSDFEGHPKFMHRVVEVEKTSRNKVRFEEKIWFSDADEAPTRSGRKS